MTDSELTQQEVEIIQEVSMQLNGLLTKCLERLDESNICKSTLVAFLCMHATLSAFSVFKTREEALKYIELCIKHAIEEHDIYEQASEVPIEE